ncbi:hypothetical protein SK128_027057 [Halocaridina rubra]|uniref:Glutamate carboxypeptidase n=1 Tax=Halocaridina rubra TaxID=373956 RepID=A0AAN8XED1_HALRR
MSDGNLASQSFIPNAPLSTLPEMPLGARTSTGYFSMLDLDSDSISLDVLNNLTLPHEGRQSGFPAYSRHNFPYKKTTPDVSAYTKTGSLPWLNTGYVAVAQAEGGGRDSMPHPRGYVAVSDAMGVMKRQPSLPSMPTGISKSRISTPEEEIPPGAYCRVGSRTSPGPPVGAASSGYVGINQAIPLQTAPSSLTSTIPANKSPYVYCAITESLESPNSTPEKGSEGYVSVGDKHENMWAHSVPHPCMNDESREVSSAPVEGTRSRPSIPLRPNTSDVVVNHNRGGTRWPPLAPSLSKQSSGYVSQEALTHDPVVMSPKRLLAQSHEPHSVVLSANHKASMVTTIHTELWNRMSGESYTRWRSEPSDDEDEEGGPMRQEHGNSSVTVVTPTSRMGEVMKDATRTRLICIMALTCITCACVGGLIGYRAGTSKSKAIIDTVVAPVLAPDATFEELDTETAFKKSVFDLKQHLRPDVIKGYIRQISQTSSSLLPDYLESTWRNQGFDVTTTAFTVDLSKPDRTKPNTVMLTYKDGHKETLNPLPAALDTPPFLAYSPAGIAIGAVVYGHYGRREDLQTLQSLRGNIKGSILLLRHGKLHPGSKLHNAEQAGAAGVLFYPDPADIQGSRGGGSPYPNGTGLPDDGVIWKSLNTLPGDPATPFLPSLDNIYRASHTTERLPGIPAHVISSREAARLMTTLDGPEVPDTWRGGLGLVLHEGIRLEYNLGGGWLKNVTNLTLAVNNEIYQKEIKNIHATMPAQDNTRVIMLGCHYGSLHKEPGVGLASLLALSESLYRTFSSNWPHRKIVFSAWAATQYGMIGSTEFTQLYGPWVDQKVLGYLSLDDMLFGTGTLRVMSSPTLRQAIRDAATMVEWPVANKAGITLTVRDGWRLSDPIISNDVHISSPGSGSDFVSFTAQHGVPSAHFVAMGENWANTYSLRHSQYDSINAFTEYLDPTYKWTQMISTLVGTVAIIFSEKELPPIIFNEMSGDLYNGWQRFLDQHSSALNSTNYDFQGILDAIEREIEILDTHMDNLNKWYQELALEDSKILLDGGQTKFHSIERYRAIDERLQQLLMLERRLQGPRGVGRTFTTNVMIGPDPEDPESPIHYPHVSKAITLALNHKTPWQSVHQELSYVLAALTSYRELFPLYSKSDMLYPS